MSSQYFDIQPVAGRIGAEIVGLDLSANLSHDIISDIRKTLVQYKVIFFRNQQLDANGQVAFARRFGVPPLIPQYHRLQDTQKSLT